MWRYLSLICFLYIFVNESRSGSISRRIVYRRYGGTVNKGSAQRQPQRNVPWSPPKKPKKFKMVKLTNAMEQDFVDAHNAARASVSPTAADMVPLEWDKKVAKISKKFVKKCSFKHSAGDDRKIKQFDYPLGENLFVGMSVSKDHTNGTYITGRWDGERKDYNYYSLTCTPGKMCGHYTQVVWAGSRKLGCAIGRCPSISGTSSMFDIIAACHYGPPGNWRGEKPYKLGESCSACPADASNTCKNHLCY